MTVRVEGHTQPRYCVRQRDPARRYTAKKAKKVMLTVVEVVEAFAGKLPDEEGDDAEDGNAAGDAQADDGARRDAVVVIVVLV